MSLKYFKALLILCLFPFLEVIGQSKLADIGFPYNFPAEFYSTKLLLADNNYQYALIGEHVRTFVYNLDNIDDSGECTDRYWYSVNNCANSFSNFSGGAKKVGMPNPVASVGGTVFRYVWSEFDISPNACLGRTTIHFMQNERYCDGYRCDHCNEVGDRSVPKGDVTFCVLQTPGKQLGNVSVYGGNTVVQNTDGLNASFKWTGPEMYCNEVFDNNAAAMQVKLVSFNNVATTADEQNWDAHPETWQAFKPAGGANEYWGTTFPLSKGYGLYVFKVRIRDKFGNKYGEFDATVTGLPSCYNDVSPTVSFTTAEKTINSGYVNGDKTSGQGGYLLEKNKNYTFQLFKPGEITDISSNYIFTDNTAQPLSSAVTFSATGTHGTYNMKVTAPGSYTIYVKKAVGLGCDPYNDGCQTPGYCQNFKPINLFIGGQNQQTFEYSCLIRIPADLYDKDKGPLIFPNFSTNNIGKEYMLSDFVYTVKSKKGILLSPGTTSINLTAGAVLSLYPEDPEPPSPELADDNKNWTQTWTYDESGQITGESKSFFDQMGRATQSQVKNLNGGVVLASQTIYDRFGRTAIQTLPAPVIANTLYVDTDNCGDAILAGTDLYFLYQPGFVTKGGTAYDFTNFDKYKDGQTQNKLAAPDGLDKNTPGSLGWYYSTNNKAGYSSLAEDGSQNKLVEEGTPVSAYPYSRTIYKEDGTGMVEASTLPGDYHHSGTGHYSKGDMKPVDGTDSQILTDYIALRNALLGSAFSLTDLVPGTQGTFNKVYKTLYIGMPYRGTDNVEKPGSNIVAYIDADEHPLISYHVESGTRSFTYYNDLGRVVYSVSPNGVEQWKAGVAVADIDKSSSIYNNRGEVISSTSKDGGTVRFMYRKDGTLRYTQDAEQAKTGKFSYVNYDRAGRSIETGEFTPTATGTYSLNPTDATAYAALKATLEYSADAANNCDLHSGGTKADKVNVLYDVPVLVNDLPAHTGAAQDYLAGRASKTYRDNGAASYYSYDNKGRLTQMVQLVPGLNKPIIPPATIPVPDPKTITYKYAANGQLKEVAYQPATAEAFYHYYSYDKNGSIAQVYTGTQAPVYDKVNNPDKLAASGNTLNLQATYEYYLHGPLKKVTLAEGLQETDYTYTVQGWLKAINDPAHPGTGAKADVFAMQLDYFSGDYTTGSTGSTGLTHYDGLVKQQTWRTAKPDKTPEVNAYSYSYDNRYQLSAAVWGTVTQGVFTADASKQYTEEGMDYDANGNIRNLRRYAAKVGTTAAILDDFKGDGGTVPATATGYLYAANSNRLSSVKGYASYSYNDIGQMTEQTLTSPAVTRAYNYNSHGLTASIREGTNTLINYAYDEGGFAYRKERYDRELHTLASTDFYVRDASGNVLAIYQKPVTGDAVVKERPLYGGGRLGTIYYTSSIDGSGETVVNTATIYDLSDHLGSTRARFMAGVGRTVEVSSYADYYPYGLAHKPEYKGSIPSRNGYQGDYSEYNEATGLNEFELRLYDPVVGRWNSTDPYGQSPSPYMGMGNNPVINVDPNGGVYDDVHTYSDKPNEVYVVNTNAPDRYFQDGVQIQGFGGADGSWANYKGAQENYHLIGFGGVPSVGDQVMLPLNGMAEKTWDFVSGGRQFAGYDVDQSGIATRIAPVTGDPGLVGGTGSAKAITRSQSVLGHIFRDASGHVNPSTLSSQNRYIRLFESIANDSDNLNPNVLSNYQRTAGGFEGFSKTFKQGQVWIQTHGSKVINAGINFIGR